MGRWLAWAMVLFVGAGCGEDRDALPEKPTLLKSAGQRPGRFHYTASRTNDARTAYSSAQDGVELSEDESVMVGTCGLSGSTASGDTVLRLYKPDGTQVASNDDACYGRGSRIDYTAPAAGTYRLRAGCADTSACEGTLVVSRRRARLPFREMEGTHDARTGTFDQRFQFKEGDTVRVSTCAFSAYGASASGDTYLRLFKLGDGAPAEVASNDDARTLGCGPSAEVLYTVPSSGAYEVRAGCAGDGACAGTLVVYVE